MKPRWSLGLVLVVLLLWVTATFTQAQESQPAGSDAVIQALLPGTAFTYQGQLLHGGGPVNNACDFQFSLWDAASGGNRKGSTINKNNITLNNGLFTVTLDFGAGIFQGDARWLEIAVRCPAGSGSFTTLSPRQSLTPVPYALALPGLWTQQSTTSPNIVGGNSANRIPNGVYGGTIGGGGTSTKINKVSDDYSTVAGGYGNVAGNNDADLNNAPGATVSGGLENTASGGHATIGGGIYNVASGTWDATVGGGYGNEASGQGSTIPGGIEARAFQYGQMAYASGKFANTGDAQASIFVVRGVTTDDDWHSLFLDGAGVRVIVPSRRSMTFDILVIGRSEDGKSNGYRITGVVENAGMLNVWASKEDIYEDDSGWDVRVEVDAGGALHVKVNGDAGDTVRWVASIRTVEVAW